ncbi:MAG: glycoside hydrolase family 3 protein [Bacilli bacterium]|nr:glycoside hydrolase family 3 protein [Candidatus Izemoplasmatales bacterium]MDD3171590.1 glycoside hydrolase family 3 protein [Bacilli bacterium]
MNIKDMTLEEKIGQMLCFAFNGTEYNEQLETQIKELKVGGIIYFAKNITSPLQAAKLNARLQKEAKIPLFTCIDQEGGSVLRVTEGITPFPGAMGLAATGENIKNICYNVAKDLKSIGFNLNHAPVADVNNNPLNPVINSRSYSDDPKVVAEYVCEAFKGFQEGGVLPTVKHFPGHGNTSQDSHLLMPSLNSSEKEMEETELVPFQKAFDEGIDGVMVSHVLYTAFDSKNPATLSYNIMTDLLQKKMGFKGLIVTDSLSMGAIEQNYSTEQIVDLCVNGGVDMMIFCGAALLSDQKEIVNKFIELVKEGRISVSRIDTSVEKILRLKEKYCQGEISIDELGPEEAINEAVKLSEESVSLVRSNGILPIRDNDNVLLLFPEIKLFSLVDNENQSYKSLKEYLPKEEVIYNKELKNLHYIKEIIGKYDKIIMATYNVIKDDYQTRLFTELDKKKTVVVSMRSPYDIMHLSGVENYICIYEATPLSLQSLSKCLLGKRKFVGKVPVKL